MSSSQVRLTTWHGVKKAVIIHRILEKYPCNGWTLEISYKCSDILHFILVVTFFIFNTDLYIKDTKKQEIMCSIGLMICPEIKNTQFKSQVKINKQQ